MISWETIGESLYPRKSLLGLGQPDEQLKGQKSVVLYLYPLFRSEQCGHPLLENNHKSHFRIFDAFRIIPWCLDARLKYVLTVSDNCLRQ